MQRVQDAIQIVLSAKCETQTIEVKAAHEGTPKVYDTLSSFSNQAEGGVILFGISEDDDFAPVGVFDVHRLQEDLANQCKEMEPEIHPQFYAVEQSGVMLVGMDIAAVPMALRPVYRQTAGRDKGSYTRVADQDLHMTQQEIYEIDAYKNGVRDDLTQDSISQHDLLDETMLTSYVANAKANRPHMNHRSTEEVLNLTGVEREGIPTLAGLLSLADYPQYVYPNLCLTAVAVPGKVMSQASDGTRFLDNKRFEGPINQIVDDATAFVVRNTKSRVVVEGGKRHDVSEYPENAVREIILNSLVHRDYGAYSVGTPVRLVLYSDRLECVNPGGIYGGQSVEDLGYENLQTRNPTLISILEIQGTVENRHSGIPIIREEMESAGLPAPVFEDRRGMFTVKLYNSSAATQKVPPENALKKTKLTESALLEFCQVPRTRKQLADHFGRGAGYIVQHYVQPLIDQGKIQRTNPDKPRSKNQQYFTVS